MMPTKEHVRTLVMIVELAKQIQHLDLKKFLGEIQAVEQKTKITDAIEELTVVFMVAAEKMTVLKDEMQRAQNASNPSQVEKNLQGSIPQDNGKNSISDPNYKPAV